MNYRIDKVAIDPHFPFSIFCGSGFSVEDYKNSRADLHRHFCLEINYCLHGTGWYEIGDQTYPIETGDLFVINDLEYHRAINESGDMQLLVVCLMQIFCSLTAKTMPSSVPSMSGRPVLKIGSPLTLRLCRRLPA